MDGLGDLKGGWLDCRACWIPDQITEPVAPLYNIVCIVWFPPSPSAGAMLFIVLLGYCVDAGGSLVFHGVGDRSLDTVK